MDNGHDLLAIFPPELVQQAKTVDLQDLRHSSTTKMKGLQGTRL